MTSAATMAGVARDFVVSQSARFSKDVLPPLVDVWNRLQVPDWPVYREALRGCAYDVWQASQSTFFLLAMTLRPLLILIWIVGQFLFRNLLEHGGRSLQKGAIQAKTALIWFYHFQRSLTWTEILGEATIVLVCVAAYFLRKWLRRQTYWARTVRWYKGKKERALLVYTRAVHKVARVSKIMAMALPHSLFLGLCIAFRFAFPAVVRWLADETYVTAILSVHYPFLATVGVIQGQRHPNSNNKDASNGTSAETQNGTSLSARDSNTEGSNMIDSSSPLAGGSFRRRIKNSAVSDTALQQGQSSSKRRSASNSSVPTAYSRSNLASSKNGSKMTSSPASETNSTTYWLRYWALYALVQAVGQFCYLIPVFGRIITRNLAFYSLAAEFKLLFFVWLFGMEGLLGNTAKDAVLGEALPLRLIHRHVTPWVLELQFKVSEAIPPAIWQRMVVSKAQSLMEMLVMVRFLSQEWKNWIVNVLDESRVLILPSLTLLMPGFVTQFGVAYVQFVVPSAKSSQARGDVMKLLYLEYWVLHCMVAGFLNWFSGILWWVPFSTHIIFILWSYIVLPPSIREWYGVLESELIAFGLLKGSKPDSVMALNNTKTARLFHSLASRLPSALEENFAKTGGIKDSLTYGQVPVEPATASAPPETGCEGDDDDSIPGLGAKTSSTQDDSDNEASSRPATTSVAEASPHQSPRARSSTKRNSKI